MNTFAKVDISINIMLKCKKKHLRLGRRTSNREARAARGAGDCCTNNAQIIICAL